MQKFVTLRWFASILALALFGNAHAQDVETPMQLDSVVGENKSCIYARNIRDIEVIDEQTIAIRVKSKEYWVNHLANRCAGLRKNMLFKVSRYGSQLCAQDRLTAQHRGLSAGSTRTCILGEFAPANAASINSMKSAGQKVVRTANASPIAEDV